MLWPVHSHCFEKLQFKALKLSFNSMSETQLQFAKSRFEVAEVHRTVYFDASHVRALGCIKSWFEVTEVRQTVRLGDFKPTFRKM